MPQCLESRSFDGYTALAVAFRCRQLEFARLLIKAGADQRVRDRKGRNLVHLLFADLDCPAHDELRRIQSLLELINPLLISSLLIERSSSQLGLLTPLAYLMSQGLRVSGQVRSNLSALELGLSLAKNTNQEHLEIFDHAGDTPIHRAVQCQWDKVLAIFISHRSDILLWENASGFTPMDLARDMVVSSTRTVFVRMCSEHNPYDDDGSWNMNDQGVVDKRHQIVQNIHEICEEGHAQLKNLDRKLFTPAALYMVVAATSAKQGKGLACETDDVGRWIQDRS